MAGHGGGDSAGPNGRPRAVRSLARTDRRRLVATTTARVVVTVVVLVAGYYLLPFDWDPVSHLWVVAVGVAVFAGLIVWPLRTVAHAELPELRAIEAVASAGTLSVVLFASIYLVLSNSDRTAFSEPLGHTDALYLSMTTLTTVGFGDVSASSAAARVTVMVQMLATFVVLSVVVRLVWKVVRRSLGPSAGQA